MAIFLKSRWYVAKVVYSLIGIYDIPEPSGLGRAGGQGPEAPARPASLSVAVTGFGLDSDGQNAAIELVASATASIMAGSRLVRWEVCGAIPGATY